jgi:hypothetical protein
VFCRTERCARQMANAPADVASEAFAFRSNGRLTRHACAVRREIDLSERSCQHA